MMAALISSWWHPVWTRQASLKKQINLGRLTDTHSTKTKKWCHFFMLVCTQKPWLHNIFQARLQGPQRAKLTFCLLFHHSMYGIRKHTILTIYFHSFKNIKKLRIVLNWVVQSKVANKCSNCIWTQSCSAVSPGQHHHKQCQHLLNKWLVV